MKKTSYAKMCFLCLLSASLMAVGCAATPSVTSAVPQAESAQDWKFHDIVTVDFVKPHITFPKPDNVLLIDSRPKQAKYDKGHIPTAINIPDTHFEKMTHLLPADKNTLLIFYCEGPECKLSHKSAQKAEAMGYKNVKVYMDGFPGWMKVPGHYAEVPVEFVKEQIDSKSPMTLVDSRPKEGKFDQGHIPTAINIPDTHFDKMTQLLPADKNQLLVFYCGGFDCKLSHKSAEKAIKLGYTQVKVFSAGYPAWLAATPAAADSSGKIAGEVKKGKLEGTMDIAQFDNLVKTSPSSIYLIDVRDPDEFAKANIKTSINIPVDKLEKQIGSLPVDKPIVFICGTGARSGESYYMMKDLRPAVKEVYYLEAEMKIKPDGSYTITAPK
ncbi:MAG: rhodanese-like domain-containing protein [Desulfatirhabdiaceae bacterium]